MHSNLSFFRILLFLIFILINTFFISCEKNPVSSDRKLNSSENIFVLNALSETLTVINPFRETIVPEFSLLGSCPNYLEIWNNKIVCVNSGNNNLQIISPSDSLSDIVIDLKQAGFYGINPWEVEIFHVDLGAVTNLLSNNVIIADLKNGNLLYQIPTPPSPEGILFFDKQIFVSCVNLFSGLNGPEYGQSRIIRIETQNFKVIDTLCLGINIQQLTISEDGFIHALATGNYQSVEGVIYKILPLTMEVTDSLPTGASPQKLLLDGDVGIVSAWNWQGGGKIIIYDTENMNITKEILTGTGIGQIQKLKDRNFAVCLPDLDKIRIYNPDWILIRDYPTQDMPICLIQL